LCGARRRSDCPYARSVLELAGHRPGADLLLVRPRPSVRARAAPRDRHRSGDRHAGSGARLRLGLLRGNGPAERQDGHDPDLGRVLGHARTARLVLGAARPGRLRGSRGWDCGLGRRRWPIGTVRPPRRPLGGRRRGLPRPAPVPARARHRTASSGRAASAAGPRSARPATSSRGRASARARRRTGGASARQAARRRGRKESGFRDLSAGACRSSAAEGGHARPGAGSGRASRTRDRGRASSVSRRGGVSPCPPRRAAVRARRDLTGRDARWDVLPARRLGGGRPVRGPRRDAGGCGTVRRSDALRFARPSGYRCPHHPLRAPARGDTARGSSSPQAAGGGREDGSYH